MTSSAKEAQAAVDVDDIVVDWTMTERQPQATRTETTPNFWRAVLEIRELAHRHANKLIVT